MKYRIQRLFDLSGKVAIVTGALGILGREFCAGLAAFGAHVIVVDFDQQACTTYAAQLQHDYKVKCIGIACDVSKSNRVRELFATIHNHFPHIHIVLNNAASKSNNRHAFYNPLEKYTLKQWREIMSTNIDGMFLIAREAGKSMIREGTKGSIIQTSSIYGWIAPDPRLYKDGTYLGYALNTPAVYSTSKAAVHGLTRHLAAQWAPYGIRVNTLVPGGIEHGQNETFKQNYASRTPLQRMGRAEEMVGAVLYMASDASSYMTGQALIVDGGFSSW